MIEVKKSSNIISVTNSDKAEIILDLEKWEAKLGSYDVNFPWEYEKWWILCEVWEFEWNLYYNFVSEWKHISFVKENNFELKNELQKFLNHIDILIINGSKETAKLFENIESKIVIPYWDGAHTFFTTLWQNPEEQKNLKIKDSISWDNIEFINLV